MADYVTRTQDAFSAVDPAEWDRLLAQQPAPSPFMRHAYLSALERSGSANPATGWAPTVLSLSDAQGLAAACVCYVKDHSYGEYVFDWAWARAYHEHGLNYYPKAVVAVPFTPVPGTRLLARDTTARAALARALQDWAQRQKLSSLHLLFGADEDIEAARQAGWMMRQTVQFHWSNATPAYRSFDDFLGSLQQEKRKKIRQERRKVQEAGVGFEWRQGRDITPDDWDFFYRCYERTYLGHGNAPYLGRDFFARMAQAMPAHWLMFIARREGRRMASSLIGLNPGDSDIALPGAQAVAYGRYWGALERVDCLHFEACYYQPLEWCIAQGYERFEGGAQGEHKMARALLPVQTCSAHWLAHPAFADAVARFLDRETQDVDAYLRHLASRNPLKSARIEQAP